MLDDRRAGVLQALVEEYIGTGQPVSSQAILERSALDVSSATIRNDLAKLESDGFVAQPHTSAGRIPTDQGYRYYVDHCSPGRLRSATRARIESFFADVHLELSKLLRATSGLLSDLSHYPSIVIGPGITGEAIRGIHLVQLARRVLLLVTITDAGRVTQEIVRIGFDPTDADLDEAERTLERLYVDRTLEEGNAALVDAEDQDTTDRTGGMLGQVGRALESAEVSSSEVFVGGTSQLASLWEDLAHVDSLLGLLDRDTQVRSIIDSEGGGTAVRIGSELALDETDVAVVSTSYEAAERGVGRVGIIGPTRMDYRRTIKLVEEVGEGLGDSLGR